MNEYQNWMGFPGGASGKESGCQCRRWKRHGFNPWVGKFPLEKGMATHSSILAWRIPWTETARLQCMGLQRVRNDWSNLALSTSGLNDWPNEYRRKHILTNPLAATCITHDTPAKYSAQLSKVPLTRWCPSNRMTLPVINMCCLAFSVSDPGDQESSSSSLT